MTIYLPRSEWTTSAASGDRLSGTLLRGVAVHWPGTTQDRIGDPGRSAIAERLQHYRSYHLGKGWRDIGYNLAIDQAGRVWMCRSTEWKGNMVGAHCASASNPDANEEYVGVLLLLGDQEPLSDPMIAAFRDWYHDRFLAGWPSRYDVRGHGQVIGAQTDCPGPFARAVVHDLTDPNPQEDEMNAAQEAKLDALIKAEADRYTVATNRYADLATGATASRNLLEQEADRYAHLVALIEAIPTAVVQLDDNSLAQIAKAVADEQARRQQA